MAEKKYNINQRRLRANAHIRELASDVNLSHKDFIQPLFIDENISVRTPIASLSEVNSDTIETAIEQIESDLQQGISKFLLFPVPKTKSENEFNFDFVVAGVKKIKEVFGSKIWLVVDVCLCAYTSHGHCGIMNLDKTKVLNNETVKVLANYSLHLAKAGADCIAPSDMMDGRIAAIRAILDDDNFDDISIMSYSSKFSSQFYGPFRDACKSSPDSTIALKDRKSYQASFFNKKDVITSTCRDISDGADIVMVKPAIPYLDIIQELSKLVNVPLVAYHVSGEYQSIELLAQNKLVDRSKAHVEVWTSLKRAGANSIISYASRYAKKWIAEIEY